MEETTENMEESTIPGDVEMPVPVECVEVDTKPNMTEIERTLGNIPVTLIEDIAIKTEPGALSRPPAPAGSLCCCCLELSCRKQLWGAHAWMGRTEVYGDMLRECFSLALPKREDGVDLICEICITHLRNALKFRRQVVACQSRLAADLSLTDTNEFEYEDSYADASAVELNVETKHENEIKIDVEEGNTQDDEPLIKLATKRKATVAAKAKPPPKKRPNTKKASPATPAARTEVASGSAGPAVAGKVRTLQVLKRVPPTKGKSKMVAIKIGGTAPKQPPAKRKKTSTITIASQPEPGTSHGSNEYLDPKFKRKARMNAAFLLKYSSICPFKFKHTLFYCFYCNKPFMLFEDLPDHVKKTHGDLTLVSIMKCIPRQNIVVKVDITNIQCKLCFDKFNSVQELVEHLTQSHRVNFNYEDSKPADDVVGYELADGVHRCAVCMMEFDFFNTLNIHMNEHSTNYFCDVCGRSFLLYTGLSKHMVVHSNTSAKCKFCDKVYRSQPNLRNHVKYAHEQYKYQCSLCGDVFKTHAKRLKHLIETHGKGTIEFKCRICSKEFNTIGGLRGHKLYAHSDIPRVAKFECDECGRMFTESGHLKSHKLIHKGEKNQQCEFCNKKFLRMKTLKEHLKIHNNDKRWSCALCAQAFVQKTSLTSHIRVHHPEVNVLEHLVYTDPDTTVA